MKNIKYISASAGSGKTYTLTKTVAEAVNAGDVEPENVILTTFTKVAAAEFKEKAKEMLYEQGLIAEADRLDQALIGTIHSVAESLIQKYWYVLGLSPKINPIAEKDLEFFKNQSLLNLLEEGELSFLNGFAEEFSIKKSMSVRIDYDFWKTDLWRILEFSKNYGITDYTASITYSKEITASLVEAFHHIKVDKDQLENILNKAKVLNEADESENQPKIRFLINSFKRKLPEADGSSFKYAKEILTLLDNFPWRELSDEKKAFAESLGNLYSSEEVRKLLDKYIDLMFALAARWMGQYADYKKEHHLIDFSDMESYFAMLLDNEEVAADIKNRYKYVFVDEFQDCSPMQVNIFIKLSDIVEHSVWVGDKKQAIYAFRGSDTELTSAVMDKIKENEKKGLISWSTDFLDKSWRSLPSIVNFTNEVFAAGFEKTDAEGRREVCLEPQRKDGEGQVGFWWIIDSNKAERAKTLARNIISMINDGEKTSDIAVLARTNSDLEEVAAALREYDVPVYIDEDGLSGTDTVSLVSSLLQLVADETAELPKAQIAFLTEADYRLGKILDDKIAFNSAEEKEALFYKEIPLVKKLLEGRGRYKNQSLSAMVESIIIELDLYGIAKKLNDDADSAKLLHAIIDSAAEYEEHCALMHLPVSIMGFVTYLSENDVSVSGSTEGVHFFTYHKSKGLEWKNVIILGCEKDFLEEKALVKRNFFGAQLVKL
ncbi:MAG: UvrD-helicase domain-containing protein, partial [Treponema sp.]|nr:UvrD-helicase domain-containing protein [Treponema sp.]